jgi:hypothetical protein
VSDNNNQNLRKEIPKITIRFVEKSESATLAREEFLSRHNSPLDQETLKSLMENGPKMQEWISEDGDNLQHFLDDPIESLKEAGIHLDERIIQNIRRIRQDNIPVKLPVISTTFKSKVNEVLVEASKNNKKIVLNMRDKLTGDQ